MSEKSALVMFLGGLDSLGALWVTLNDPQYARVHVHHINIENIEKRAYAESLAVKKCLLHIANTTNFKWEYSESTIALLQYAQKYSYDSDIISFVAGNICLNNHFTHLVIGVQADDLARDSVHQRVTRGYRIFEAFDVNTVKTYPVNQLSKQEIFNLLPPQLRACAWSCRTPQYIDGIPHKCNVCPTCIEVDKLSKGI